MFAECYHRWQSCCKPVYAYKSALLYAVIWQCVLGSSTVIFETFAVIVSLLVVEFIRNVLCCLRQLVSHIAKRAPHVHTTLTGAI